MIHTAHNKWQCSFLSSDFILYKKINKLVVVFAMNGRIMLFKCTSGIKVYNGAMNR